MAVAEDTGYDAEFAWAEPAVRADGVDFFYGEGQARFQVLFDNRLDISPGQLVVMTGPSGSGKTTMLTLIGALRSLQQGRIEVLGHNLAALSPGELVRVRRGIGFIFQMHNLFDSLTAYENVKLALQLDGARSGADMRERGVEMLEQLGLGHRLDHKPHSLSGGQRQRVAIARALVNRPKLVLADEPTAALDKDSSRIVVDLLKELTTQEGCTVIMVTHDVRIIELADRIVNIVDGTIRSDVVLRDALMICEFLRTVDLFKNLTPTEITNIAERMKRRCYRKDEIIIRQGDPGEEFFLTGSGRIEVRRRGADGHDDAVATLGAGQVFGEHALMVDEPRNATCVAGTDEVEVFVLRKDDFRRALETSASFKDQVQAIYFQRQ
jgi:putative ABC transport system ATP-binding protein